MRILRFVVLAAITCGTLAAQPQALRIFIRSSAKTHGAPDNGNHDYPAFLAGWTKLLTARGAAVGGAPRFPTADELLRTDVLIDYASDGANISPAERIVLDEYLKRGGGLVVIHDGMCGSDGAWFATVAGGAKQHGERNSSAGKLTLHFEDPANPILAGMSDFEMDDEMFFLLRMAPEAHVLATAPDPAGKIVPQLWTYEKTVPGGRAYRAFVSLQGHRYSNFEQSAYQTILLRGIAWAGRRPLNELLLNAAAR
jgi:type 1 glutamine amidotransferase